MAKHKGPLSDIEREQRRCEQRELVRASIEQLRSSEGWRAWLAARARFRSYSPRNVLLILSQHPTAERVAGFRAWLDLGYHPARGATAIRIWAPCPPTRKALRVWRENGADPGQKPRTGWRLACVFAQDQVAELPPPATPAPLTPPIKEITGESHEALIGTLIDLAREIGYHVAFRDTGRVDGYCQPQSKRIVIAERLTANGQLVTLIHELAHALVAIDPDAPKLDQAHGELVAESVAFCCADTVGLDSGASSIPYLASWAQNAGLEVLEQTAALTDRLAARIETALLAEASTRQPAGPQPVHPPAPGTR
jgi:N-terminal domain of anti-restriction factor ArdC